MQSLEAFCDRLLDLTSIENSDACKVVLKELPVVYANLIQILNVEKSNWLPHDVSIIVK